MHTTIAFLCPQVSPLSSRTSLATYTKILKRADKRNLPRHHTTAIPSNTRSDFLSLGPNSVALRWTSSCVDRPFVGSVAVVAVVRPERRHGKHDEPNSAAISRINSPPQRARACSMRLLYRIAEIFSKLYSTYIPPGFCKLGRPQPHSVYLFSRWSAWWAVLCDYVATRAGPRQTCRVEAYRCRSATQIKAHITDTDWHAILWL